MSKKAFYSDEDIEQAKSALAGLPDLTPQRKSQKEFLDAIRDDLLALVKTKGYTVSDIRETLKTTGYEISERALREIVRDAEKNKSARKKRKSAISSASTEAK
ncbi:MULTISPECIES: hypothetical protein [Enterobacteriaceae]|uniref:Molybdopterin-guanine dinucleotide biosynthesis protein MobC n=1 Tax=Citrobacter telavivensis TaxID=2653932 RepID=A0A6L5EGQ9_9ENTR|nr:MULTISPECIES: hypothetical protein [Enterobacteriaceae]HDR2614488.1 molybdopterin-guanine dinucleotide biosynthesis protein MobC [Enterobacter ludwigii]KLV69594.1 hypothetical protein SK37_05073 [Citrobacter sp. MGH109]MDT7093043.1 molybdopterin-guanine dinucleotide biosynthesis protein MobC [Citrobacter freundii]MPQ54371.1 molybdopterin-guanine dinucleotide biosynthesis protein MobC [Citrobacter telavivensis]QFS69061.1 molybdopterin-guanine dinucleotide biosynthesis protein MobC [Citrobact